MKKLTDKEYKEVAEYAAYKDLINKFPSGILSLVSDTYDIWTVITNFLPKLKDEILARDGKLVIRPDSGDPVDIICGDVQIEDLTNDKYCKTLEECGTYIESCLRDDVSESTPHGECGVDSESKIFKFKGRYYTCTTSFDWNRYDKQYYFIDETSNVITETSLTNQNKGVIELLWEVFGGDINEQGYKRLDSHIGAIYGDSINLERAKSMFERLESKGFASSNIVLGVGSYSLQFVTRDTHGFAQKATYIELGEDCGVEIFKDPITDDGTKKSAKGLLRVDLVNGEYILKDQCTKEEEKGGELQVIYEDGIFFNQTTFEAIRERLNSSI